MHSQAAKHIQSSRYGCFYYARVDENLPRMSDCRISASSLFNGALPYADRRMWLFFFAALLFLHALKHTLIRAHIDEAHCIDEQRIICYQLCGRFLTLLPRGARNDVRNYTLLPPWLGSVQSSRQSLSEVVMAREPRPLCAWICQARARATATHVRLLSYLNSYLRFIITVD